MHTKSTAVPEASTRARVARGLAAVLALVLAVALAACGGSSSKSNSSASTGGTQASASASSAQIQPPSDIKSAGQIIYCTDFAEPPLEFRQGSATVGSDVDMGNEIGRLMGVKAVFQETTFDGIIAALLSQKCDAIISAMTVTPRREQQVDFVPYLTAGYGVLIRAENADKIHGLDDLSGKSIAVEVGTSNESYIRDTENAKLKSEGKAPIQIVGFPQNNDAVNALRTNRVDAYFADGPHNAYIAQQDPGTFKLAGPQVATAPFGIALRKDETALKTAIQQAVTSMYKDGFLPRTLTKWGIGDTALKGGAS